MNNKKILVAGGAGYIGSHMVKQMLDAGYRVITLDNLSTGHRDLVPGGLFIKGDIGNAVILDQIFSEHRIDVVMHFAAYSLVGESVKNPLKYYRNNLSETIELLMSMIRHKIIYFVFSSTAAVYGEPAKIPITEEHPCSPANPYGASKLAVESLLKYCESAYGLKYACLRYFNAAGADGSGIIGERHEPETHLIPLILKVATGEIENIKIFGTDYPTSDGTCIRDYIHVNDLSTAHILALEALLSNGKSSVYNLGNSRGYSVRKIIDLARKVTNHSIPSISSKRRPGDPAVLIASSEKIKSELGWKPRYEDMETIIRSAWIWHQKEACQLKTEQKI
ncbi:MAG TPA: UDP-glucose 4-epimerase GalE [Desulfobacteraceae bacterium]|nr:UDP-glucose 4-epimerase GalE [Desulfobacteraceae bacterium]